MELSMRRIHHLLCILLLVLLAPGSPAQDAAAPRNDQSEEVSEDAEQSSLVAEAAQLISKIEEIFRDEDDLKGREFTAKGEELAVVALQLRQRRIEVMRELGKLVANVAAQQEQGLGATDTRTQAERYCTLVEVAAPKLVNRLEEQVAELRTQRDRAEGDAIAKIEEQLAAANAATDETFKLYLEHVGHLETLGMSSDRSRAELGRQISQHAESLGGHLELARTRLKAAQEHVSEIPGDAGLKQAELSAKARLDATASRLALAADVMVGIDLDVARYRQTLIQATGQITGDVLDVKVARGLLEDGLLALGVWGKDTGPKLVIRAAVFLGVLFIFWLLAALARRLVERTITRLELQLTALARDMVVKLAGRTVILFGFFLALSQVGVEVGALLAGLGIAGFIVGFALQDSLGNFACGALILIYRPYDVNDVIEASGIRGRVSHMTLVSTTILTFDNETLVVPNNKIWGGVIKNVSDQEIRRVDMAFRVSYAEDVPRIEAIFAAILKDHPMVLDDPGPLIKLHKLEDSWVEFAVRPWVATADYWTVYWDVTREVKLRFDREGIRVPFPQQQIHVSDGSGAGNSPSGEG
jgi:small conductance mechanosensitive channel